MSLSSGCPALRHLLALAWLLAVAVLADEVAAPVPPTPEEQAVAEVVRLLAAQDWTTAAEQAQALTEETKPPKIRLAAFEHLAVALAGLGEPEDSAQAVAQAEALFRDSEKARLASSSVYFRNRLDYDGVSRHAVALQRRCQEAAQTAGHELQETPATVGLARRFPDHPSRRTFALEAGEQLLALSRKEEAIPWFVAALDTGLDRSFVAKAKYSENQVQLDAIAKAPSLDLVQRALVGLFGKAVADSTGDVPSVASRFQTALELTRQSDDRVAIAAVSALTAGPVGDLARLELARTHLRGGRFEEARMTLAAIQPERGGLFHRYTALGRAVAAQQEYLLGIAANQALDYRQGADHFAKAVELGEEPLGEQAGVEQARSLELAGEWTASRKLYRQLAESGSAESVQRAARIALDRLDAYGREQLPADSPVVRLPDDRETFGDWYLGYGGEQYVLCAHNYVQDMAGGPGPAPKLSFSTTDPKERSRLWVSDRKSDDPAALWNPLRRVRFPANRDDRGEQYAIGRGPDLLMDAAIPAGQHILSLYFVNDAKFYEANRRYTTEVRSGDRLLALADVRDFGTGVYQRFLVAGPCDLHVHLRRDAAMNVLLQGVFLDPLPMLDPPPLAEESASSAGNDYAQRAQRLVRSPAELLAHPDPMLALAAKLGFALPDQGVPAYRLFLAAGRPRSARRVFEDYVAALPADLLLPAANGLAVPMQARDPRLAARTRDWPDATHPLDLLAERWFAVSFGEDAPSDERIRELVGMVQKGGPYVTPYARKRALGELARCAPQRLTAPLLLWAGSQFKSEGDHAAAVEELRQVLAMRPDPRTELRASFALLDLAPQADLPVADARTLHDRIQKLATAGRDDQLLPAAHLHLAEALAFHGEYAEAIRLLDLAPPEVATVLREQFRQQLAERPKERAQ